MTRLRRDIVRDLITHPERLLLKKPFTRGSATSSPECCYDGDEEVVTKLRTAQLPRLTKTIVSQERFAKELDPGSHKVLFDNNMPSICVKISDAKDGSGYSEIEYKRTSVDFQERIRQKKTLSLCGNPRVFTLHDSNPDEAQKKNFADLKWHWTERNQDGLSSKAVYTQLGYGDVGLLMYFNERKEIRGRIISYEDGYVIISHNDDNGERVLECIYYSDGDGVEHIDCYDDENIYRLTNAEGWHVTEAKPHGFSEIPLITKRGNVAWNDVQNLIETFEIIYNIFIVIQKRHGWGILYIRGRLKEQAKKLAGSIILQDTDTTGNGSAEFKAPPTPQNMIETLQTLLDQIQIGASVTFILPKDVKSSGDISGIAMQMTRSLDIEGATQAVIDWQNFADKHARLFKEGLAKELVEKGENPNAITEFERMKVTCKFKMWQPFDEGSYNQMLCTLKGAGIISQKTGIEKNTISTPDEEIRVALEQEKANTFQPNAGLPRQDDNANIE